MLKQFKKYGMLHGILLLYSLSVVCSKLAAREAFLSVRFILYYGGTIGLLFIYALLWQQILKALPLVTAYANKSIVVVWGMLWGVLLFQEKITVTMLIGTIVIFIGVYLVVSGNEME